MYGGTEEEMKRLLKDAKKLTGIDYNIDNLADVYGAIHAIQENLGVAGTTADEAEKTFSGSFAQMKASVSNLFGALSTGGDVKTAMSNLIDSASTFLFDNAIPMIGNVFSALPSAIKTGISKIAPKLSGIGKDIAYSIRDGLKAILPSSMSSVVDSAFDGLKGMVSKIAPVIQKVKGLFERVAPLIGDVLGKAFSSSGDRVQMFAEMIRGAIPLVEQIITSVMPVVTSAISVFSSTVKQVLPFVSQAFSTVATTLTPIITTIAGAVQSAFPVIQSIISTAVGVISTVMPVISNIFSSVGAKIQQVVGYAVPLIQWLGDIFEKISPVIQSAIEIVSEVLSSAWNIISPILDLLMTTFEAVWNVLSPIIDALVDAFVWLWDKLEPIFSALSDAISWVSDAIGSVADFIGDGISWLGGVFGFAYGKDRVPYDNYPAVLHEGEKVLTRNQADQYERVVSTRGVQIQSAMTETAPRDTSSTTVTEVVQTESTQAGSGITSFNIERLADTVVIEKEADVDKVVEDMITKFKKLVPNMA